MYQYLIQGLLLLSLTLGQSNILSLSDQTLVGGDTAWVEIEITNTDEIAGFQFDLQFPEELTYSNTYLLGNRFTDHDTQIDIINNYLRVISYSSTLTPISDNSGVVLTLGFLTNPVLGVFNIDLINPVLANTNYTNVLTEYQNATITLDTPAPQITPFTPIEFSEETSFTILYDTLLSHTYDVDTPLEDIEFTIESDSLIITEVGGNYLITPPENWNGRDTLLLTASDGFYYGQEVWPVFIININDPPVLSEITNFTIAEDNTYLLPLQDYVLDVDDRFLDLSWEFEPNSEFLDISLIENNSVVLFTPDENFAGENINVVITVRDTSNAQDTSSVRIDVIPVNDAPVFSSSIPDIELLEDSNYIIQIQDLYPYVSDVDDDVNTLTWNFIETNNISVIQETDNVLLIPDQNWFGTELLTVTVSDTSLTTSADITIHIESVNDAPLDFDLITPEDGFLVTTNNILISWDEPLDVDDNDLQTFFHYVNNGNEIVAPVFGRDTILNVFVSNLPYGNNIEWWIEVSDGELSTYSEHRTFVVSEELNHIGPDWYVDHEGSNTEGNGSQNYPFKTIQHALDISIEDDSVFIHNGTYYENLTINHSIVITGLKQFNEKPILDGNNQNRIISIDDEARVTIRDLVFRNGYLNNDSGGAAIYSFYEPLIIMDCEFYSNVVNGGGRGGAIESHSQSSIIRNCIFENNQSLQSSGGALSINGGIVDSCSFKYNSAGGNGGAVNIEDNTLIKRSLFVENSAESRGGAIYTVLTTSNVINCTIYNNQAENGGGISNYNSSSNIVNTILWNNSASLSGHQIYDTGIPSPEYSYCDVEGGVPGTEIIDEDPIFLDANSGYFDLIEGSPCIDRGDPDLDGDDILWVSDIDDQDIDGTRMDIGAFTFLGPDTIPPSLTLFSDIGGQSFGTGEIVPLEWNAEDDRVINWTKVYLSYDGGTNYNLLDSLSGNPEGINWQVFDSTITDQGKIKVVVSDWGDNLAEVVSEGFFNVVDIINPEIVVSIPGSDFTTYEYALVVSSWEASDNIALDSISIFYTNDGNTFDMVGEVSSQNVQFEFNIPSGVTELAQVKLVAKDESGNITEALSSFFSVTDNTPPQVTLENMNNVHIGDEITSFWNSNDNSGLDYHRLFLSDNGGNTYVQLDSVAGGDTSFTWFVPNLVTENALLSIISTDIVGLHASDTTDLFSISDGIKPNITITDLDDEFSIPEFQPITIEWNASDNIQLDSAKIWYSNNNGNEYFLMGVLLASSFEYTFSVPQGLTHQGLIKVEVYDVAQNVAADTSDIFTVTDYTPPVANIISPVPGNRFDIDGTMEINWDAYDNVEIDEVHISFSIDLGESWEPIFSNIPNTGLVNWMVTNNPSNNFQLRTIVFDEVGLSDTSIVDSIFIDIIYPQVLTISPEPGTINWLDQQIIISFNQMMLSDGFNDEYIRFESNYSDSVNGSFEYVDSTQQMIINLSNGFSSLDTVNIILDANGINNYYGYPLDGDKDGMGGDDYQFQYHLGLTGDYNNDQIINGSDLSIFISSYNEKNYENELGPYLGEIPHTIVTPDENFNIEDVMSFVVLGNWFLSNYGLVFSNNSEPDVGSDFEISNDIINISMPKNTNTYDLQLLYDIKSLQPNFQITSDKISLVRKDNVIGSLNVISEANSEKNISLSYQLKDKNSIVQLIIQYYDINGEVISKSKESLELNAVPDQFLLQPNYPNPFNPTTKIDYGLPSKTNVSLVIYDILGREVITLFNGLQEPGYKSITWNGTDALGRNVGAGMYFYLLQAGDFRKVNKMILLK